MLEPFIDRNILQGIKQMTEIGTSAAVEAKKSKNHSSPDSDVNKVRFFDINVLFRPDENIKVMVGPLRALQNARHGLAAYVEPSMMTEGT